MLYIALMSPYPPYAGSSLRTATRPQDPVAPPHHEPARLHHQENSKPQDREDAKDGGDEKDDSIRAEGITEAIQSGGSVLGGPRDSGG